MKSNKSTYFSSFFLLCFLALFSVNTIKGLNSFSNKSSFKNNKTITVSSKEDTSSSSDGFLFEENETEIENDFLIPAFILPFFVSCFLYSVAKTLKGSFTSLTNKFSKPLYITVRNIRI